jgi:Sec-independent protein secretion pathway component TatC
MVQAGELTPSPDIASLLLMFNTLYGFYELSILVAVKVEKGNVIK